MLDPLFAQSHQPSMTQQHAARALHKGTLSCHYRLELPEFDVHTSRLTPVTTGQAVNGDVVLTASYTPRLTPGTRNKSSGLWKVWPLCGHSRPEIHHGPCQCRGRHIPNPALFICDIGTHFKQDPQPLTFSVLMLTNNPPGIIRISTACGPTW